ncbi:MAG TPA: 50S ribosomal protein L17 [Deltaproteobacteria bacterium]|jgi:large subunit ribosomal protein L17|nr:50S ribosomal protein L17 [Deltaproteobacteria bacterium]
MRHGVSGRKLNRTTSHRLAMFRNMVTSLLNHERIYTTVPKAKEMRRWAEWMITLGKHGGLHCRRQALAVIREKNVVYKVFEELAKRYENRAGGYTRIVKVGFRRGDAAPMCMLELITEGAGEKAKKKGKKPVKKTEAAPAKAKSPKPKSKKVSEPTE